jgi:hypothetical protein
MSQPILKSSLSEAQRQLVALLQWIHFGRVEDLHVHGGVPLFDPPPRIIRKLTMGAENSPRRGGALPDFWLKPQESEMLQAIADLGDGIVPEIVVQQGLPISLEIEFRLEASDEANEHA